MRSAVALLLIGAAATVHPDLRLPSGKAPLRKPATAASPLDFSAAATDERAIVALTSIAGGSDIDHASMLPNMYSLLQLGSRMLDMERLEAGQYFELIEDPLMNLFVPVLIQAAMDIIKKPVIDEVCGALADALASSLAEPMGQAIFPGAAPSFLEIGVSVRQDGESEAASSAAASGSHARRALHRAFASFPSVAELVVRAHDAASLTSALTRMPSLSPPPSEDGAAVGERARRQASGVSRLVAVLESAGLTLADAAELARQSLVDQTTAQTESSIELKVAGNLEEQHSSGDDDDSLWPLPMLDDVHLQDPSLDDGSGEQGLDLGLDAVPGLDLGLGLGGGESESEEVEDGMQPLQAATHLQEQPDADAAHSMDGNSVGASPAAHSASAGGLLDGKEDGIETTQQREDSFNHEDFHPGLSAAERWALVQKHQRRQQRRRQQDGDDAGGSGSGSGADVDFAAFLEMESGVEVTVCSMLKDERACLALQPPASAGRCSWCAKPGDSKGKCVPCLPARVAPLLKQGYQCGRDEAFCAALEAHYAPYFHQPVPGGVRQTGTVDLPPPAAAGKGGGGKPAPLPASSRSDWLPDDDKKLPVMPPEPKGEAPPNEAAAQNDKTAEDATAGPLAHLLHGNLVPLLRSRLRKKLVRTVMREAAAPATVGAVERLHAGLPQLLVRSIAGATTRRLSVELTRTLTSVLVPTLGEALARHPAVDIVCGLCDAHGLYCDACRGARRQDGADTAAASSLAEDLAAAASRALAGSGLLDVAVAQSLAEESASVVRQGKPEPKRK